jgi:pimeloyl-ACP methyl ester carboxylesterase
VHGFIVHSATWTAAPLYQELLRNGFRVITLDLRGNGKSDRPHRLEAYQGDAEARDVMALLKHLGIKEYAAVGYSRGAIITARLLVLDPQVQAAVLGGMGSHFTNPNWPRRIAFANAFLGIEPTTPMTAGALQFARSIGADTLALGYSQQAQPVSSPEALRRVKQPVLVIAGDEDSDNGPASELAAMLGNATQLTVPGDHNNTMRSSAFAAAVVQFLKVH